MIDNFDINKDIELKYDNIKALFNEKKKENK